MAQGTALKTCDFLLDPIRWSVLLFFDGETYQGHTHSWLVCPCLRYEENYKKFIFCNL
jgi:hypothetical protein